MKIEGLVACHDGREAGVAAPMEAGLGRSAIVHQRLTVTYEYEAAFTDGLFDPGNPLLADTVARKEKQRRHRCLVFLDAGLLGPHPGLPADVQRYFRQHAATMELVTPPIIVPGGEGVKNDLSHLAELQKIVFDYHIDRHSFIIAVGGGAMLDAVGFVAATAHRGVRLVRAPTTLLGQCDSGVGVKNAVNLFGSKNYWGSFAPPFAVLNDAAFLRSLPVRERIAGMAEAVKVALIRDAHFFRWIEENTVALARGDEATVGWLIRRCAELHMHQIAHGGDPFEMGSARPLDFGHWAAHRLETQTEHKLRHGEAVAIGIALDTRYSVTAGLLPAGEELRVALLLERLGFRLWQEALQERAGGPAGPLSVIEGLREFREHLGGDLTITLIAGIGQGIEVHSMDETQIEAAINWLKARDATR